MTDNSEVRQFLEDHLGAIGNNDVQAYHSSTHSELTLYEWWITPHRIDGLPFHDFMIEGNEALGTVFGADQVIDESGEQKKSRFDLSNLKIQRYGDTAIASYTLLISSLGPDGVHVSSHNESRVMVRFPEGWQVVHVHKSPSWKAPHERGDKSN